MSIKARLLRWRYEKWARETDKLFLADAGHRLLRVVIQSPMTMDDVAILAERYEYYANRGYRVEGCSFDCFGLGSEK